MLSSTLGYFYLSFVFMSAIYFAAMDPSSGPIANQSSHPVPLPTSSTNIDECNYDNRHKQYQENRQTAEHQHQEYEYIKVDKISARNQSPSLSDTTQALQNEPIVNDDYIGLGKRPLPGPPVYDRLQH